MPLAERRSEVVELYEKHAAVVTHLRDKRTARHCRCRRDIRVISTRDVWYYRHCWRVMRFIVFVLILVPVFMLVVSIIVTLRSG